MIIDLHHHLVYGVDDGAKDLDMSKKMLQKAVENHVNVICCTSHATPGHAAFPWDTYLKHMETLGEWIIHENLPLTLYTGCEILFTEEAPEMARRGEIPTLANRKTVLVEFLPNAQWGQITRAVREFTNCGLQVVCAHVERYRCLHEDMDRLFELHEDYGVICQMNGSTIIRSKGLFGDKFARKALKAGLIDVAASDAHNAESRPCNMKACRDILSKEYGEELARELTEDMPYEILIGHNETQKRR